MLSVLLIISLCGCSLVPGADNSIETLKSWSFQYNEGTNDYSLFFGLCNKSGEFVAANVDVDIRIENDEKEEIYKDTKSVSRDDFDYYSNEVSGEQYLANVRILADDIMQGKSENGTVYFTVYKENIVDFDEVNCSAMYCLPISDVTLTSVPLPINISVKGYGGSVESEIEINDVSYVFEKDTIPQLKITVSGVKTYGTKSSVYDRIMYKLYEDDSIIIYDIIPGENYTLKLTECDW